MSLTLERRIEKALEGLNKAKGSRWQRVDMEKSEEVIVRESETAYGRLVVRPSRKKGKRHSRGKSVKVKAHKLSGRTGKRHRSHKMTSSGSVRKDTLIEKLPSRTDARKKMNIVYPPATKGGSKKQKDHDIRFTIYTETNEIQKITTQVEGYLNTFETRMEYLLDKIWYYDKKSIEDNLSSLSKLGRRVSNYIILDSRWSKKHKLDRDEEDLKKMVLLKKRIELIKGAMNYITNNREIPDAIYFNLSLEDRIKSFLHLGNNWDEEGAKAVTTTAVENALKFLKTYSDANPTFVVATRNGKVVIDFSNSNKRLEAGIINSKMVNCIIIENRETIIFNEVIAQADFEKALKLLNT